ncbi:U3 snoRNP protein, partial [Quaeritorhiza haematococci]
MSVEEDDSVDDGLATSEELKGPKPAWEDEDTVSMKINIAGVKRLRKLRTHEGEEVVSGAEYERRLKKQFEKIYPLPQWAALASTQRTKIAGKDEMLYLRTADGILEDTRRNRASKAAFKKEKLDVVRLKDANQMAYSQAVVQSVQFHPTVPVLLTAGLDKTLRLFQIDGKINTKIQSVFLSDLPIHRASFTPDGREIIATGRRKFFYAYDVESGTISKIPSIRGGRQNQTVRLDGIGLVNDEGEMSLEKHFVSPCNRYIVVLGRDGYMMLVARDTKQWIGNLKMNGVVKTVDFSKDGRFLYSAGGDGEVYVWDLNAQKCLYRFQDDGAIKTTAIAVSPNGQYICTG